MIPTLSREMRASAALLALRIGCGYFLLVWGVNKLLVPGQSEKIYSYFYGIETGPELPIWLGIGEIIVAAAIILGLLRPVSYAIGLAIHGTTVAIIAPKLFDPFLIENAYPTNRGMSVSLAALGAFIALYLMRDHDKWSVDVLRRRFRAR